MRHLYDPQSLWALTGLAVRNGQRIGLHRESTSQGLSLFEAEIRRRLWWQIIILDSRSAQLSGAAIDADTYHHWDTKRPLNVNDSDLNPTMKEPPVEHIGITEMLFCSIRYEIGEFMRRMKSSMVADRNGQIMSTLICMSERDKAIDDLENRLEQNFLTYCDLSISFHLLATHMARSAVCHMRLAAHHPFQYPDKGLSLAQDEKDTLFSTSLKIIEYDNLTHATRSLDRYRWHVSISFPFEAFIYILSELSRRVEGEPAAQAWRQVNQIYDHHPELITNTRNALYFAIGNLAVKAWEKTLGGTQNDQELHQFAMPRFISTLCSQRNLNQPQATKYPLNMNSDMRLDGSINQGLQTSHPYQDHKTQWTDINSTSNLGFPLEYEPINDSAMDWEYWQALLEDRPMLYSNELPTFSHS